MDFLKSEASEPLPERQPHNICHSLCRSGKLQCLISLDWGQVGCWVSVTWPQEICCEQEAAANYYDFPICCSAWFRIKTLGLIKFWSTPLLATEVVIKVERHLIYFSCWAPVERRPSLNSRNRAIFFAFSFSSSARICLYINSVFS